jgi:predicted  nucleic acid-binding Zn-ribbon protein
MLASLPISCQTAKLPNLPRRMPGKEKESKSDKDATAAKLLELEATLDSLSGKVKKNTKEVKEASGKANKNSADIAANLRLIRKEKLERE